MIIGQCRLTVGYKTTNLMSDNDPLSVAVHFFDEEREKILINIPLLLTWEDGLRQVLHWTEHNLRNVTGRHWLTRSSRYLYYFINFKNITLS